MVFSGLIMAEDGVLDKLLSARKLLKTGLQSSEEISSRLDKTGSRLEEIRQGLVSLQSEVNLKRRGFDSVLDQMNHVISPAAAVLRVFGSVQELQNSLISFNQCSDLQTYISAINRLEDSLKLLSDCCGLAIKWLREVLESLRDNGIPDNHHYTLSVRKPLEILQELQKHEAYARHGGVLSMAFENLEIEFTLVLKEEETVLDQTLESTTLQKLQAVIQTLRTDKRLKNCVSAYVEFRSQVVLKRSETLLGTEYLQKTVSEFDEVQEIEVYIDQWRKHLEIAVEDVYDLEQRLCLEIFGETEVWTDCFGRIATNSGIISLLSFGLSVSKCKKDPMKLLKLLDMFSTLDDLRVQFNRIFGSKSCLEIQRVTRELIKGLVDSAVEIFWELPYQVELQRSVSPPGNGGVPRLVTFVTDYCNQILGSRYRPMLTKVLEIDQSWKRENFHENVLVGQIYNVLKEIARNLDSWSKSYGDISLSYIFMMNNHNHFCSLKDTHLGKMMGDSWLRSHERYQEYYAALYLKETWGRLPELLSNKSESVTESPRKLLQDYTQSFDQIYKKQTKWVVADERLRKRICRVAVEAVLPAYKNYLQNCMMLLVEEDDSWKYVKYSVKCLENKLKSMFQMKVTRDKSIKKRHGFVEKVKKMEMNQFHMTLTAK